MRRVIGESLALFDGLPFGCLKRHDDIPEQRRDRDFGRLRRGKRKHVGGFVDASPLRVQLADAGIVGELHADFGTIANSSSARLKTRVDRASRQLLDPKRRPPERRQYRDFDFQLHRADPFGLRRLASSYAATIRRTRSCLTTSPWRKTTCPTP